MVESLGLLAEFLHPVGVADFLDHHWRRASLYLPGTAGRYRNLAFDEAKFRRLRHDLSENPRDVSARFVDAAGVHHNFSFRSNHADAILAAGITVCLPSIDHGDPALAQQCAEVQRALGTAGEVYANCYLAPPGSGFGAHFDTTDVFTLQIAGEKTWWYGASPAVDAPHVAIAASSRRDWERVRRDLPDALIEPPDHPALIETTLRPGDLLYVPAGTWHRTTSQSQSLSLALSVKHFDVLTLIANVLHGELLRDPVWRARSLPSGADRDRALVDLTRRAAQQLAAMSPARILAAVDRLTGDLPSVGDEIQRNDWFQRISAFGFSLGTDAQGSPVAVVSCGDYNLTLDHAMKAFFEHLERTEAFTAEDATRWDSTGATLDWADIQDVLRILLDSGIIYRIPPRTS